MDTPSRDGVAYVSVESMRHPYREPPGAFLEDQLASREPIGQFRSWFDQACATPAILEPNAMCLSTAAADGRPAGRFVLLKGFGDDGFRFFSSYDSRKAAELAANPRAALTFYWEALSRSVRVEGDVRRLSDDVSDAYFRSRPVSSQIGAALFPQSRVIGGRAQLEARQAELTELHGDGRTTVPRPHWGGYVVAPSVVEFWQGQSTRVHDRIRFRRPTAADAGDPRVHVGDDGWVFERLAP